MIGACGSARRCSVCSSACWASGRPAAGVAQAQPGARPQRPRRRRARRHRRGRGARRHDPGRPGRPHPLPQGVRGCVPWCHGPSRSPPAPSTTSPRSPRSWRPCRRCWRSWSRARWSWTSRSAGTSTSSARPRLREITVRRVLTHSAGFPDLPSPTAIPRGFPEAARLLARAGLAYTPGSTFHYSDTGFILLGELVRRVSGEPLDQFMRKRFYRPLGMKDTAFHPPADWKPRIAPTEMLGSGLLRGTVHDGNARMLGGVAGHAGLFSTADDLARFCRMLAAGRRARRPSLSARNPPSAPCWSRTRSARPRAGSAGTCPRPTRGRSAPSSRWAPSAIPASPAPRSGSTRPSRVYAIILTNRVHPYGKGNVVDLRRRVSGVVGAAFFGAERPAAHGGRGAARDRSPPPPTPARPGPAPRAPGSISSWRRASRRWRAARWGSSPIRPAWTHRAAAIIDLLAAAPGVRLRAIFSPEHGITGQLDANVPHGRDVATGLPIWSLYGSERRPHALHDGRRGHLRLRHPGRGGPLLHLPDDSGLRPRGRGAARDARDRARPAQPHHRAAWSRGR